MSNLSHQRFVIQATLGKLHVDAAFELTAPWTVIFGPSGSGKSSILRGICGLLPTADRTPPHRRNLAYAPQNPSIFPHLTVRENVAFPLTVRDHPPQVDEILDLFALTPLASRLPRDLSGGELQRTSLARAYAVPNPTLILLDEPFTGIDRSMRDRLISVFATRTIPILSVTHDVEEALLLTAEVLRLEEGRITAIGPASKVLAVERAQMLSTLENVL